MKTALRASLGTLLVLMTVVAGSGMASATTTVSWTGNGSENLPCADAAHWVLSPAKGITSATLVVGGTAYTMVQNGEGSFAADSAGAVDASTVVTASYEGANTKAFLKLSHCETGTPPPPPPA